MLYQLFWKSPVFLMGAMGWPNIYTSFAVSHWETMLLRAVMNRCGLLHELAIFPTSTSTGSLSGS
jgi:hypothetical protein